MSWELGSGLEVPTQEQNSEEVLTRELGSGLEALMREHKFGLDAQVPHEAWFCGLKHGDKVACVGIHGTCPANGDCAVVSSDLCAPVGKRICMVRAHDWLDFRNELSVEHQVEPFLSYLRPLLSQVADNTDASWWLLVYECFGRIEFGRFQVSVAEETGWLSSCQWVISRDGRYCRDWCPDAHVRSIN